MREYKTRPGLALGAAGDYLLDCCLAREGLTPFYAIFAPLVSASVLLDSYISHAGQVRANPLSGMYVFDRERKQTQVQ